MPEVNLMKDTQGIEPPPPKPPAARSEFDLSDPDATPKGPFGFLRKFFNTPAKPPTRLETPGAALPPKRTPGLSTMGLKKSGAADRIIEAKRQSRPTVVPLPEDEGGFNVNLLTEDLMTKFDPRTKLTQLGMLVAGAVVVIALAYVALAAVQKTVTNEVVSARSELLRVKTETGNLKSMQNEMTATTTKINAIKGLIDRHVRWTNFFHQLEKYTIPQATYGPSFSSGGQGIITLTAKVGSFEDVATQYLVFQQAVAKGDFIGAFSITGASRQTDQSGGHTVTYSLSLALLPELFTSTAISTTETPPTPVPATVPTTP